MARYVSTKTASGGSGGGGAAGVTLAQVCTAVCNTVCNLATQTPASQPSPLIMPGFGCWEMICNCPCWDKCYGCCIIWCVDTTKYKGFKIHYNGVRTCACCYQYLYPGFGTDDCFCCCSNTYRGKCTCNWPLDSCCCWCGYQCCWVGKEACIYCNSFSSDQGWSFEFCVMAPRWKTCTSGNQGLGIWYDWSYKKWIKCCDCQTYTGCDRAKGNTHCSCIFWNCDQNSNYYLSRICLRTQETPFQSTLKAGNYTAADGAECMLGVPCWTIWAIPCDRPCFGTCCMETS